MICVNVDLESQHLFNFESGDLALNLTPNQRSQDIFKTVPFSGTSSRSSGPPHQAPRLKPAFSSVPVSSRLPFPCLLSRLR